MAEPRAAPELWEAAIGPGRDDGRLVAESSEPETQAELLPVPEALDPKLGDALTAIGIERLYAHQAHAFQTAATDNLILTSGTASGKSLAFNLPVLNRLAADSKARALYLYPTKALTQDQVRKLQGLRLPFVRPGIYDGDTPSDHRPQIRRRSNILLTNPDMLHVGILPNRDTWQDF
ncbi:MAG: DEAD/DEAH box helicase, partial [Solirubrobacterales bacterium]